MKLGFAKKRLELEFPVALAGFGHSRIAYDQLDEIYVKVIVVEHEEQTYGVLSYDVCAIDESFVDLVKQEIEILQLMPSNFLFSATHTHSAPAGIMETSTGICKMAKDVFGSTNESYRRELLRISVLGLKEAILDKKEGSIFVAKDTLPQIGKNRNDAALQGNDTIWVAYASQKYGDKVTIMNFACHPTVLSYTNTLMSADIPGAIDSMMMRQGYKMNIFLNGSAGDISTRFTRQGSGVEELNRLSAIAVDKVCEMKQRAQEIQLHEMKQHFYTISCKLKKKDTTEHAEKELRKQKEAYEVAIQNNVEGSALRLQESFVEGAEANLRHAMYGVNQMDYLISISIWTINNDFFICIPGELFSELSNQISDEHVHFINYANGYLGYFANHDAYDKHYYEALSSPFAKGEGERFIGILKKLLKQCGGEQV